MDKAYIIDELKKLAANVGLDVDEGTIERVVGFSQFKVYSKGQIIKRIGEDSSCAGIVVSGVIRSFYVDPDGNDITRFFSCEGNACMDEGLIGLKEICAMWEAVEESTVMLFEVDGFKKLIMSDERLKRIWIDVLESGMRYKVYRENGFLVENATERYLNFRKRYPTLCSRVPQKYIATYLGIKPESLSRIRNTLKEEENGI